MLKNKMFLMAAVLSVVAVAASLIFVFSHPQETGRIYTHIYIHGVPVGGMSRREANAILMERFQTQLDVRTVKYTKNGELAAEFSFADFGAKLDFGGLLDMALEYSYLRNFPIRISRLLGRPYEIDAPVDYGFDPERMQEVLNKLSENLDESPQNASFSKTEGQIMVYAETDGHGVDIESAAAETRRVLDSFVSGVVELNIITVKPRYTTADFEFTKSAIGIYETPVADSTGPRGRNVKLAASRINNQVLYPGQVFSAGARIAANKPDSGYEVATVLVRGEPVSDIGGGVCQVVTTLYNAVLLAELEVVQRHNHSARVSYVDLGFDATVAGDYFDLKFKNSTDRPLLITTMVKNERLHVELIGYENRPSQRSVRFVANKVEITPPEPYREIVDPTVPRGEKHVTLESQMGYRVELHKIVYMGDDEIERVKINTSIYKPLQGVIAIGSG